MKKDNFDKLDLVNIYRQITDPVQHIVIDGKNLTIQEIYSVTNLNSPISFTDDKVVLSKLDKSYQAMLSQVAKGVPIYGCNTGYGARAEVVLNTGTPSKRLEIAKKISESIVHTDVSVGPELNPQVVRGAILIRLNMLINGVSAVRLEDLDIFRRMINERLTPVVHAYGGLGASGDLAHNGRVLSAARQLAGVKMYDKDGVKGEAASILKKYKIPALKLEPKAGLGLVNGDNFSTAAAAMIVVDVIQYSLIADVLGAMMIEVLKGSNRSFHPFLSDIRPHPGQAELAKLYLYLLKDSKLAYQELKGHVERARGIKIQDAYSLRCLTQAEGFNREQLKWAVKTITINANSVSDNPLWVAPEFTTPGEKPWQWVSGGNFFAGHMGEVIDAMRKIITRLVKRNDRHLHRLVSPHDNNGLPANLSDKEALSMCAFKGIQLQSGMFDVYAMLLAQPVTTMFGIHEETNQDLTPHSLTSAILAWENLRLLKYSLAMNLLAVAQATDLRGGPQLLSPKTQPVYDFIRKKALYVTVERPLFPDIEAIAQTIDDGTLMQTILQKTLKKYS